MKSLRWWYWLSCAIAFVCGRVIQLNDQARPALPRREWSSGGLSGISQHSNERQVRSNVDAMRSTSQTHFQSDKDELIHKLGLSQEEIETSKALSIRKSMGENVLMLDPPFSRRFIEHDVSNVVARAAATRLDSFGEELMGFGVSKEQIEHLNHHLTQIQKASMFADIAAQQFQDAQEQYKNRIQSLMTPENYDKYLESERTKPASSELNAIQKFATDRGLTLGGADNARILELLRQEATLVRKSSHGPFDAVPTPAVGASAVLKLLNSQLAELNGALQRVTIQMQSADMNRSLIDLVREFYGVRVAELREQIRSVTANMASRQGL